MSRRWKRLTPQRWWAVTYRDGTTFAILRTRELARVRRQDTLRPADWRIAPCWLVEYPNYKVAP